MYLNYDCKRDIKDIYNESLQIYKKNKTLFNANDLNKNMLIQGDNFNILSMLLYAGFKEKIDLIYIDPPFNTNSIFQFEKGKIRTISNSNKAPIAYNDKMNKDHFIEFLRERIILMKNLLSEKGSIYVHIDSKYGAYLKIIMDEIFGEQNFLNEISRIKSNPKNFARKAYGNEKDIILFYAKHRNKNIFNNITIPYTTEEIEQKFKKIDKNGKRYNTVPIHAPGESNGITGNMWKGMQPPPGRHWRTSPAALTELDNEGKIEWSKTGNPRIKKYANEHKGKKIQDVWLDYKDPSFPSYPTEKNHKMLQMIIQQSSNPKSIVLDAFSGSGSIGKIAYDLGRQFILIDNSKIAINLMLSKLKNLDNFEYKNFEYI